MMYKMNVKQLKAGVFEVTSETKPGQVYYVDKTRGPKPWCTCPDHVLRGNEECKHMEIVEVTAFERIVTGDVNAKKKV